jgi:hypothetical protein
MLSELFLQVYSSLVAKWRTGRWDLSELTWKVIFQAVMISHRGNWSRAMRALDVHKRVRPMRSTSSRRFVPASAETWLVTPAR